MLGDKSDDVATPELATARPNVAAAEVWARPDEFAEGAARWARRVVTRWSEELHPLLGEIGKEKATDVPSDTDLAGEDADLATPLYRSIRIQVPATLNLDEVLEFDVSAALVRLYEMADESGRQLERGMLEHISAMSDEYGRTVDASGRDFIDALIDSLESLEFSFGEDGEPVMPTVVVHPDTMQGLRGKSPTVEQQRRISEIIERKREERRASQRRTDLP